MNAAFRFILLLVLSLAIPMYGFAGLAAPQTPCPMESGTADFVGIEHHVAAGTTSQPDCCNDPGTSAETGQPCKAGQQCPGVHAVHVPVIRIPAMPPVDSTGPSQFSMLSPGGTPASIWRPPAAL